MECVSAASQRRCQQTTKMAPDVSRSLDDLVQKVTLHSPFPTILHGYSFPFIVLYSLWAYFAFFVYGIDDYVEPACLVLAGIGLIQVLVSLSCYWSVHVRTFVTCNNQSSPLNAVYAKVVPTANNGSSQLVYVRKEKVRLLSVLASAEGRVFSSRFFFVSGR